MIQAVEIALGCLPELQRKTLFLEASHTLVKRFGDIRLILTKKDSLWRLAFIVLEGISKLRRENSHQQCYTLISQLAIYAHGVVGQ